MGWELQALKGLLVRRPMPCLKVRPTRIRRTTYNPHSLRKGCEECGAIENLWQYGTAAAGDAGRERRRTGVRRYREGDARLLALEDGFAALAHGIEERLRAERHEIEGAVGGQLAAQQIADAAHDAIHGLRIGSGIEL
jgi:hypothetical protein